MQQQTNDGDQKHLHELMRRSSIYDTMPHELLVQRLDILEGIFLGTVGHPASPVGIPGEEEADFLEGGESGLTPDDEAALAEMAAELFRN